MKNRSIRRLESGIIAKREAYLNHDSFLFLWADTFRFKAAPLGIDALLHAYYKSIRAEKAGNQEGKSAQASS
jgi:hypothetical protein